jgi:AraC family transcriptional regulator, regulatory protein of adaptative response / DNA-3-methyladenine glycosylase II
MALTRDFMLARFLARDATQDGRFYTGVVTTGIYCLPSCPARKPKPDNVRFYTTEPEARAAGFRPCRRCHPERLHDGRDPDLERLQAAVRQLREQPAGFDGVGALAKAAAAGVTKLNALVRAHYHTTPAQLIAQARIAAAERALDGGARSSDTAWIAGYESLSAFNEGFLRWTGLRPGDRRRLGTGPEFELALPAGYRPEIPLRVHGRDGESPAERVSGRTLEKILPNGGSPVHLRIEFAGRAARCTVENGTAPSPATMRGAHAAALRMLGLPQDPGSFERRISADARLRRLVKGRRGVRIPRTADSFEALAWAIIGQQVNLAFAYRLRRALIERAGSPAAAGLMAHPTPYQVARLDYSDLTKHQYSRRKAEYLIDAARAVSTGAIELRELELGPASRAERTLLDTRGIGPWSAHYLMMRGLGFNDCVPVGDTGLAAALERLYALDHRPDALTMRALMEPFAPHRSLATFHLWLSLGDAP